MARLNEMGTHRAGSSAARPNGGGQSPRRGNAGGISARGPAAPTKGNGGHAAVASGVAVARIVSRSSARSDPETTFSLGLGLTNECDLACAHCYRDPLDVHRLSLAEVKTACESLSVRSVNLGTGENGLHPEFLEIVDYLQSLDVQLSITSNGFTTSRLDDARLRRFHSIEFSLDFPTEAEQDRFRGPGNWRLVVSEIERCKRLGVAVSIAAVMMNVNYAKLADVARVAASLGATCRVNVYQSVQTDSFAPSYEQFWEGFRRLFATSELLVCNEPILRAVLGFKEPLSGGCGAGTVRVTPAGRVLPCVYWPEQDQGLAELARDGARIRRREAFRQATSVPAFCRACEYVETCGGGCAARRKRSGRLDEPDPYCPFYRGEDMVLPHTLRTGRDFPKAASACTVVVQGRPYAAAARAAHDLEYPRSGRGSGERT